MTRTFSFWHGSLSWIELLSAKSIISTGHHLTVYTYFPQTLQGLPRGVVVADARTILPYSAEVEGMLRKRPAVAADIFRYRGLEMRRGIWLDLDMLMLRHMSERAYFMAREKAGNVNNCALYLQPDHPVLRDLLAFTAKRPVMAPWWTGKRRIKNTLRNAIGMALGPEDLQWGVFGPKAITHYVAANHMNHQVSGFDTVHPVPFEESAILLEPGGSHKVAAYITPATLGIHLWGNSLRKGGMNKTAPPEGSFLDKVMRDAFTLRLRSSA